MNTFGQIQKQSLADLLRSGHRFTPQEISVLMTSAARSLAVRHKNGYIHGHICPETIVIRDCSNLYFCCPLPKDYQNFLIKNAAFSKTDISRTAALTDDADLAISEKAAGPYRALESYIGSDYMTPAADVYSLCCVMYRPSQAASLFPPPTECAEKLWYGLHHPLLCPRTAAFAVFLKKDWRCFRPTDMPTPGSYWNHWHSCDRPPRHHLQGRQPSKMPPVLHTIFYLSSCRS